MSQHIRRAARWTIRMLLPLVGAAALTLVGGAASAAVPEPIAITSYEITDAPEVGSGLWSWSYTGTYTPTRVDPIQGKTVGDYRGGAGTLNDGVRSGSVLETQLFWTAGRGQPQIILQLAEPVIVDNIELYGGYIRGNALPGGIEQVTVTVAGTSATVPTEGFGPISDIGIPFDDRAHLEGTPLAGIKTDTVVLSGFVTGLIADQFSITEIVVNRQPATTAPLAVGVDILPALRNNVIVNRPGATIPVAVLSTATFDAPAQVQQDTLTFGRTGTEPSLKYCGKPVDINRDRRADLVCWFTTKTAGFTRGDTVGRLQGGTITGQPIQGADAVRVI